MNSTLPKSPSLRPPKWLAEDVLGCYQLPRQRAPFWEFVYRNGVPHVRIGQRKIMFNEAQVLDWLARRAVGKMPRTASGG